ncbi:ABC transporter permease subunit [Natrarchaeobius halalkaliphilus]|uniref:ABC transporter permease subunit n=1 Tax=Natrarchaeobius halalkaliphilus TaxID=1679091 RepID=A0A3N6P0B1_9EURY|nr:ABC transporter permease subunit [Natrarchaeobius halalkaliphilus]RQG87868.1 ABC transporter permease subunit [Natrarchaeobius halalkaliphilus]
MSENDTPSEMGALGTIRRLVVANNKFIFVQSILSFLVIWHVLANTFGMADTISSPSLVASSLYELLLTDDWYYHVYVTLRRSLYGFVFTIVVGTALGVAMGISPFFEKAFRDYVIVGLALPTLFAAVFSAMWFGLSDVTPMVAGALIAFPFITQNVYEGVKDVDQELVRMAHSFSVSRRRVLSRIVLRSIMPEWFSGARYSFAICWKVTTLTELIIAQNGIGYMIARQMSVLSLTGVITWTVLFMVIILVLEYGVFQQTEKIVFAWREKPVVDL